MSHLSMVPGSDEPEIPEYSDRYTALGIEPTDCDGPCEGTGVVPVWMPPAEPEVGSLASMPEDDPVLIDLWRKAEEKSPAKDGWHFVPCPKCDPA
jgi:hypothetical protein